MTRSGDRAPVSIGDADLQRLIGIIEGSHDAIISKTLDGVVTSWNRGAEEVFGYTAEEILGRPIAVLFPPELVEEERDILARLRRGERIENYETERLHKSGARVHVSLSVSPIRDATGEVVAASKIARDITRQKQTQEKLDQVQAELLHLSRLSDMGQLASAFAHELNQPLSAVSNYLAGVTRLIQAGDQARALEGCERASVQLQRAGEVIRGLREFVRKGDGRRHREPLSAVVEDASVLALVGSRTEVTADLRLDPDAPWVLIDKVQIQQVIVNLIRNAVEAMAEAPTRNLTIVTERAGEDMAQVSVADTGSGLSEEVRAKLFQPFNTSKAEGMGVGLSLCRAIIESHGGDIWAEDNAGGGAIFRFTLPVAAPL